MAPLSPSAHGMAFATKALILPRCVLKAIDVYSRLAQDLSETVRTIAVPFCFPQRVTERSSGNESHVTQRLVAFNFDVVIDLALVLLR